MQILKAEGRARDRRLRLLPTGSSMLQLSAIRVKADSCVYNYFRAAPFLPKGSQLGGFHREKAGFSIRLQTPDSSYPLLTWQAWPPLGGQRNENWMLKQEAGLWGSLTPGSLTGFHFSDGLRPVTAGPCEFTSE